MADLPVPEAPSEQVALRGVVERLLHEYQDVATYRHDDVFRESGSRGPTTYGWGTQVLPRRSGEEITIWFDGLDQDIAVWTDARGWRRRDRGVWLEWLDLSDMETVLLDVEQRLRVLLADFR